MSKISSREGIAHSIQKLPSVKICNFMFEVFSLEFTGVKGENLIMAYQFASQGAVFP